MCTTWFVCSGGIVEFSVTNVVPAANQKVHFHPNEPSGPSVKTALPGPKSLQRLAELSRFQVNLPYDYNNFPLLYNWPIFRVVQLS